MIDAGGGTWEALLHAIRVNQDNISPGPVKIPSEHVISLQLRTIQQFGCSSLTLGVGVNRSRRATGIGKRITGYITDSVLHTEIQWSSAF